MIRNSLKSSCDPSVKVTALLMTLAEGGRSSYEKEMAVTKGVAATRAWRAAT